MAKSWRELAAAVQVLKEKQDRELTAYTAKLKMYHEQFSSLAEATMGSAERARIFQEEMQKFATQLLTAINKKLARTAQPAKRPVKKVTKAMSMRNAARKVA
jgi:hypothetical protein